MKPLWEYNSLKEAIKKEKEQLSKKKRRIKWFPILYIPSIKSTIIIFAIFTLFWLLSHSPIFKFFGLLSESLKHTLLVIHSGIVIIIFALSIFIAQSMSNDSSIDKSRVLLKVTFLYPLVVFSILTFFLFIGPYSNNVLIINVILIAILTITSFNKMIVILLNKYKFSKERLAVLKVHIPVKTASDSV